MPAIINREILHRFVDDAADMIESVPFPRELEDEVPMALHYAGGVSAMIGMAIQAEAPRYVNADGWQDAVEVLDNEDAQAIAYRAAAALRAKVNAYLPADTSSDPLSALLAELMRGADGEEGGYLEL